MNSSERHDALLTWASERGSGSWEEWKQACGALELEPNEAARTQAALGHVEFDWGEGRFACAPTTLLPIPGLPGQLLLTGARPSDEQQRLQHIADSEQLEFAFAEPVPQPHGPATILVDCDPESAGRFAELAGVRFESAPQLLAAALPTLNLELVGELRPPDLRYPHCRVEERTLSPAWQEQTPEGADGLWLVYGVRRHEHYLRKSGSWWHLPIREYGPYLVAPADIYPPLLDYQPANRLLHSRSRAPLPPLQARALTLCSGRLPLRQRLGDERQLTYVNVSQEVATAVARSLDVELREELDT